MIQESLKDLCARLPYNVKVQYKDKICTIDTYTESNKFLLVDENGNEFPSISCNKLFLGIEEFKPYLFPLRSMTDEQEEELEKILGLWNISFDNINELFYDMSGYSKIYLSVVLKAIEFFNKNHLDYNELIKKGLAIDCTNLNIY